MENFINEKLCSLDIFTNDVVKFNTSPTSLYMNLSILLTNEIFVEMGEIVNITDD